MPMPKFDPTINIGHILIVLTFAVSVLFAYTDLLRTTDAHNLRIEKVEEQVSSNTNAGASILSALSDMKSDLAVIKDRSDRDEKSR